MLPSRNTRFKGRFQCGLTEPGKWLFSEGQRSLKAAAPPFSRPQTSWQCADFPLMDQLQPHYIYNGHASLLGLWEVILGGCWAQLFLQLWDPDDCDPEVTCFHSQKFRDVDCQSPNCPHTPKNPLLVFLYSAFKCVSMITPGEMVVHRGAFAEHEERVTCLHTLP